LRLETFCDGVFAIAATLLIIDIKIPSTAQIHDTITFWQTLKHITPSLFAFVLSFIVIFITWVNHHNSLKLINKSSHPFLYSNGLLLLSVIFIPFPTSLMGEYLLTGHSSPAVILYDLTLVVQAIGWILLTSTALKNQLIKNEKSKLHIKRNNRFGYLAFALYSLCSVLAIWIPVTMAIITAISWIFWLVYGFRIKHDDM
jgi:uncharacterized membrane protein